MNYIQRINGRLSKSFRRPEDVRRDGILFNLKTLLFYNSVSLHNYLYYASRLFSYHQKVELSNLETENIRDDIYSNLDHEIPIDLSSLQGKSYENIKNCLALNKSQFIELVRYFRGLNVQLYDNQTIDLDYYSLLEKVSSDYVPVYTSPDGN